MICLDFCSLNRQEIVANLLHLFMLVFLVGQINTGQLDGSASSFHRYWRQHLPRGAYPERTKTVRRKRTGKLGFVIELVLASQS